MIFERIGMFGMGRLGEVQPEFLGAVAAHGDEAFRHDRCVGEDPRPSDVAARDPSASPRGTIPSAPFFGRRPRFDWCCSDGSTDMFVQILEAGHGWRPRAMPPLSR